MERWQKSTLEEKLQNKEILEYFRHQTDDGNTPEIITLIKNYISKTNSRKCNILNILLHSNILHLNIYYTLMIYFTIKSLKDNYLL